MRKLRKLLFSFLTLVSLSNLRAEIVLLNGVYNGKDLYLKNTVTSTGMGYCIFEVIVNGVTTTDELSMPVFAVHLLSLNLQQNQQLEIVIRCKEDCGVKVLNPEVILPTSNFSIKAIQINKSGHLEWATANETGKIPFEVEQFKWNRWVPVAEVLGHGQKEHNAYAVNLELHTGINTFRVMQQDAKGKKYSNIITVEGGKNPAIIKSTKVDKTLEFSYDTAYEILSEFGEVIKKGHGSMVDVSKFYKGTYYVCFDATAGAAITKK